MKLNKDQLKRWALPALGGIALVVVLLVMSGALSGDKIKAGALDVERAEPEPSHTALARLEESPVHRITTGEVAAETRAEVSSEVSARIVNVLVDVGDAIQEGDLIVRLDSRDFEERALQAKARLESAEAGLKRATLEKERTESLMEKSAATPQSLEQVTAAWSQAKGEFAIAERQVRETEILLERASIHSPLTGLVARRFAEPGEIAQVGRVLLEVHDPSALRFETAIPETLFERLEVGATFSIEIPAAGVRAPGRLEEWEPRSDPASRSFIARIELPENERLKPGMFGRAFIPLGTRPAIWIPKAAVREVGQMALTRVRGASGWARRIVTIGRSEGDRVEVLSGVSDGEQVGWDSQERP